tara:strand:- start:89 stop:409 length:321 start_codon:yes stop_codon:yes gene_type:complete
MVSQNLTDFKKSLLEFYKKVNVEQELKGLDSIDIWNKQMEIKVSKKFAKIPTYKKFIEELKEKDIENVDKIKKVLIDLKISSSKKYSIKNLEILMKKEHKITILKF